MTIFFYIILLITCSNSWAAENVVQANKKQQAEDAAKELKFLQYLARLAFKEAIEAARNFHKPYTLDLEVNTPGLRRARRWLNECESEYNVQRKNYSNRYYKLQGFGAAQGFEHPDVLGRVTNMRDDPYVKPIYSPYSNPLDGPDRPYRFAKDPQDPSAE
jgi:hypothetical protein